jgi:hypothetical protein
LSPWILEESLLHGTAAARGQDMQQISTSQLATVFGGESFGEVLRATSSLNNVPVDQTAGATMDFIRDHPFFHSGLMNAPIGGGKHFRNVPFIGPARTIGGALTGNRDAMLKGIEVTRGTWAAQ